ncbi:MAG TPA: ATP-binding cassette domain-containing protein [Sediminispirochaeta sp.]|nr:ATP-binding cassette domain-containing protein [Sediminispirochaeta sp.]
MALYRIKELRFSYPNVEARNRRNDEALSIDQLEMDEGRTYVLLGPNGSGKSTLLKLMNRLLVPVSGRLLFRGRDIMKSEELRRQTVYVHQNPLLLAGSVFHNVAYGLKLRGFSHREIERRVAQSLEVVGLKGFAHRRSSELSGGEAQRVAIARAMAFSPEVLLLDEPTSSIDKKNVSKIEELISSIRAEYGCSVIISTHNLPFAYRMADELVKLEEGRRVPVGENILQGEMIEKESTYRRFRSDGVEILCPDVEGDFKKAVIDYDRVLLSAEPLHSSAQNSFQGTVEAMESAHFVQEKAADGEESHGLVDVRLKIEGLRLSARITRRSVEELSIREGRLLWAAFKASSVRLY